MKPFQHVFYTWLLSHLFHPFVFAFYLIILGEGDPTAIIPVLFIAGPVLALPSLLLGWMFLKYLYNNTNNSSISLCIWMLMVPIAISLNYFFLVLIIDRPAYLDEEAGLLLPGIVSSCIAVLFRVPQFQQLFTSKNTEHENNLV
jgi:hypothetical protein